MAEHARNLKPHPQQQVMLMVENEPFFREQALNHALCGIWDNYFTEMEDTRKFHKK